VRAISFLLPFPFLRPKNFGSNFATGILLNVGPAKVHCKEKMSFFASKGAIRASRPAPGASGRATTSPGEAAERWHQSVVIG
jgi:hypothetical protein